MEVIRADGGRTSETSEVLDKWKNDFEALLNPIHEKEDHVYSKNSMNDTQADVHLCFVEPIQISEAELAI